MYRESIYLDNAKTEVGLNLTKTAVCPSFVRVLQCNFSSTCAVPSGNRQVNVTVVLDVDEDELEAYIHKIQTH